MLLSDLKDSEKAVINFINLPLNFKVRLYNLGVTPQAKIIAKINKKSGGLFVIKGVILGLKSSITKNIEVSKNG